MLPLTKVSMIILEKLYEISDDGLVWHNILLLVGTYLGLGMINNGRDGNGFQYWTNLKIPVKGSPPHVFKFGLNFFFWKVCKTLTAK